MDFGEYQVTVQASTGEKGRIIVHAGNEEQAAEAALRATKMRVVAVKRVS